MTFGDGEAVSPKIGDGEQQLTSKMVSRNPNAIALETGQRYLDGWTITFNHMRGHESLKNDTPGKWAKTKPPFTE